MTLCVPFFEILKSVLHVCTVNRVLISLSIVGHIVVSYNI